jgi:bifunctional non-homologous end joining protein LigD
VLTDVAGVSRLKRRRPAAGRDKRSRLTLPADVPGGELPHHVRPMLAVLTDAPFDRRDWFFEVKWDGYRAIAEIENGRVELYSRNQKSLNDRFAVIADELKHWKHDAVLDGEVVALDPDGRAQFQLLQNYQRTGLGQLAYYVFDLLYLDGGDLRSLPLRRRKQILAEIIGDGTQVRFSEHVENEGTAFYQAAARQGLEGIMAKDSTSPYRTGQRSTAWLKIKTQRRQEAVIGGFTEPRRSRPHLGSLLLGVYDGDDFNYIGHTGGGFDAAGLYEMRQRLRPLERKRCPFVIPPKPNAPVHWVQPKLVCEVKFQEWTTDGRMRQPIFLALRDDKPALAVRRERERPVEQAVNSRERNAPRSRTNAE